MRGDVTVYSPKNVLCTMGIHIASGFTEDGFITIRLNFSGFFKDASTLFGGLIKVRRAGSSNSTESSITTE